MSKEESTFQEEETLVDLQARLRECSSHSQATLRCWRSLPAQPPVPGTPLGARRAALSLPVRGTGAAAPFSRDTSQRDEDGATPRRREYGPGLPQPVSFRMLLVTLHVSHSVCGCSCRAGGRGCGPLPSLSTATFLHDLHGDKSSSMHPDGEGNFSSGMLERGAGKGAAVSPSWHPGRAGGPAPSLLLGLPRGQGLPGAA